MKDNSTQFINAYSDTLRLRAMFLCHASWGERMRSSRVTGSTTVSIPVSLCGLH